MTKDIVEGGNIVLARRLIESEIWRKPAEYLKIWIYILFKVNYKNTKNFQRGTGFFNFRQEQIPGVTLNQVYEFLRWAKSLNPTDLTTQITTQKTTRGVILKVNNYNKYQNLNNYCPQHRNQHRNQQTTNTITEIKEINNIDTNNIYNISSSSTDFEKFLKNLKKEEEEELRNYSKKNKIKYFRPWLRKLYENGDIEDIKLKAKNYAERIRQKQAENIPPEIEEKSSPEEEQRGLELLRRTAQKIKKGA